MELPALPAVPLAVCAAVLVALLFLARDWWNGGRTGRRLHAQRARADRGEETAESLLMTLGWSIEGRQVSARYDLRVNGRPTPVLVRADLLVRRGGKRYVAEVKTGRLAPRIETSSTRRQLLEYRIAFAVDGVLLVDAEAERVSFIEFPGVGKAAPRWSPGLWVAVAGVVVALVVTLWR